MEPKAGLDQLHYAADKKALKWLPVALAAAAAAAAVAMKKRA